MRTIKLSARLLTGDANAFQSDIRKSQSLSKETRHSEVDQWSESELREQLLKLYWVCFS